MDVHIMHTSTIAKLREIFATHVLPETLVTDNGPKFTSMEFANFLAKPQMDKQSELLRTRTKGWAVRACKEGMKKSKETWLRFLLKSQTMRH